MESINITLGMKDAVNFQLSQPTKSFHLGSEADLSDKNVEIRIGSRPIAVDLRELALATGAEVPKEFDLYDAFRIWLIRYGFSIDREPGPQSVERVEFEISVPEPPRVTVSGLFPPSEWREIGVVDAQLDNVVSLGVSLSGSAEIPGTISEAIAATGVFALDAAAAAEVKGTNKLGLACNLKLRLASPLVTAMGEYDDWSKWVIRKSKAPLLGDFSVYQTLIVPDTWTVLRPKVRIGALLKTYHIIPCALRSEWQELECRLPQ